MDKVIEIKELSRHFATARPVQQASFTVDAGEFVTLLGPSGSGKSTLLAMIAGLDKATSGQVILKDQDLALLNEDELALFRRDHVGFVFQSFQLIPTLTALENITLPLYPVKMANQEKGERAQALLEQVGLRGKENNLPSRLSGGEQQRVAIARALVNQPDIIFCDEPTGNLDSATSNEIINLLLELNHRRQVTIFMVTHDPNIAKISHRSLFMKDGKVS